jgi:hypothetical protein
MVCRTTRFCVGHIYVSIQRLWARALANRTVAQIINYLWCKAEAQYRRRSPSWAKRIRSTRNHHSSVRSLLIFLPISAQVRSCIRHLLSRSSRSKPQSIPLPTSYVLHPLWCHVREVKEAKLSLNFNDEYKGGWMGVQFHQSCLRH